MQIICMGPVSSTLCVNFQMADRCSDLGVFIIYALNACGEI